MLVLGIETSCDETAAAVVEDGRHVRANVVASQIATHAPYGGVVPEVASRQHVATIVPVLERAVADAGVSFDDLDAIAVTAGPGLVGALLVGVETAKALAFALGKPLVAVNHLAGHLAAAFLESPPAPYEPAVVSAPGAAGVGRPHGADPHRRAGRDAAARLDARRRVGRGVRQGGEDARARLSGRRARSTSGRRPATPRRWRCRGRSPDATISTSASPGSRRRWRRCSRAAPRSRARRLDDFCASFQAAVVDVLVRKSRRALALERLGALVVCGGVAANRGLRAALAVAAQEDGFALHIPPPKYCTDNAAMIAAAGAQLFARGAPRRVGSIGRSRAAALASAGR